MAECRQEKRLASEVRGLQGQVFECLCAWNMSMTKEGFAALSVRLQLTSRVVHQAVQLGVEPQGAAHPLICNGHVLRVVH